MEIQVDIKPEDVNKMLVDAILNSAIGEEIQKAVNEYVKRLSSSYDNPIKKVVEMEVHKSIAAVIHTEFGDLIEARVKEAITDEMVTEIVAKAWDHFVKRH